jgi:hypothetical protein
MMLAVVESRPWMAGFDPRDQGSSPIQGAGVQDRLRAAFAAQHHQQVGHHRGAALLVRFDDVPFAQLHQPICTMLTAPSTPIPGSIVDGADDDPGMTTLLVARSQATR